jgi:hypothetical protein
MGAAQHRIAGRVVWPCVVLLARAPAPPRQTPSVDEVIGRHTAAVGGRAALEAVHAVSFRLHITEPHSAVDAAYVADRQGRMRIDVSAGGERVYSEGYDGRAAWAWHHGATHGEPETAAAAAALRHGVQLPGKVFGLHELRGRGIAIDLVGREAVAGSDYFVLRLTFPDGFATHLYVNAVTFLIERQRDHRALHPDLDPRATWIETQYSDFRTVGGTLHAFRDRQVDLRTGDVLSTTDVRALEVNGPLDTTAFARPQ